MAKVIVGATMSLDGFIADSTGSLELLYPALEALHDMEPLREAMQNTGAAVIGRHAYAMAEDPDWYTGNYEFQVPIFVLTHHPPTRHPKQTEHLTFTYVTDGIESAIRQAKAAAGDKDVTVIGGASTAQQVLRAGLADELDIYVMPLLLCGGLRLFDNISTQLIQLERTRVMELPGGRTYLRFRIVK
jgi:dihydrofolate reductase